MYQLVYLSKNDLTFLVCNLCSGVVKETKVKQNPLKKIDWLIFKKDDFYIFLLEKQFFEYFHVLMILYVNQFASVFQHLTFFDNTDRKL